MLEQSLDYFLADKQGADLSDTLIAEACQTLRTNREEYLVQIGNETIISKLVEAASLWLSPDYELRKLALAAAPETTGFPREVLAAGLDACFSEWTQENFFELLGQEFGDATRLQSFGSLSSHSLAMVHGPQLIAVLLPRVQRRIKHAADVEKMRPIWPAASSSPFPARLDEVLSWP